MTSWLYIWSHVLALIGVSPANTDKALSPTEAPSVEGEKVKKKTWKWFPLLPRLSAFTFHLSPFPSSCEKIKDTSTEERWHSFIDFVTHNYTIPAVKCREKLKMCSINFNFTCFWSMIRNNFEVTEMLIAVCSSFKYHCIEIK